MSAFAVGWTIGALIGGIAGYISAVVIQKANHADRRRPRPLKVANHDVLAEEFKVHADAMAEQVSSYADQLAGGDEGLREWLRRFERGGQ